MSDKHWCMVLIFPLECVLGSSFALIMATSLINGLKRKFLSYLLDHRSALSPSIDIVLYYSCTRVEQGLAHEQ